MMPAGVSLAEASFMDDPGVWAAPDAVARVLGSAVLPATAARLLASPRVGRRASAMLAGMLGAGSLDELDAVDRPLALAPAAALQQAAELAGAVWHAPRIRALVMAAEIAAFAAVHGPDARQLALLHAGLAPAADRSDPDLDAAVALAGRRCMAAWTAALPGFAAARVALKWMREEPPAEDRDRAVQVVRAVAQAAMV